MDGSRSGTCRSRSRRARGGGSHSRTCRSRSRRAWYVPRYGWEGWCSKLSN
jgi:hypothetical protein